MVGVTLRTIVVDVDDVTDEVTLVPFEVAANETVGEAAKPVPVIVTVVALVASQTEAGLIDVMVGAASTVKADAKGVAWAPPSSVIDNVHVAATVPVDVKLAVAVVAEVSVTELKV